MPGSVRLSSLSPGYIPSEDALSRGRKAGRNLFAGIQGIGSPELLRPLVRGPHEDDNNKKAPKRRERKVDEKAAGQQPKHLQK